VDRIVMVGILCGAGILALRMAIEVDPGDHQTRYAPRSRNRRGTTNQSTGAR
jgi:hypothetical protein